MKIAIVGSREYSKMKDVSDFVYSLPRDTTIVSGGARGVDQAAERAARRRGMNVKIFLANWDKFGRKAGYLRNVEIVEASDRVVAFWDGFSNGTKHTINIAREKSKPVEIHRTMRPSSR